jgi:hypothetical protein
VCGLEILSGHRACKGSAVHNTSYIHAAIRTLTHWIASALFMALLMWSAQRISVTGRPLRTSMELAKLQHEYHRLALFDRDHCHKSLHEMMNAIGRWRAEQGLPPIARELPYASNGTDAWGHNLSYFIVQSDTSCTIVIRSRGHNLRDDGGRVDDITKVLLAPACCR